MKVLIVEDERPAANRLMDLISKVAPEISIEGITESVEETINWLLTNGLPDLVFMDIQLDDGLCFEIFENIVLDKPVIFTTAYNEYTLRAFKVNSIDYLLKPIEERELKQAISKYKKLYTSPVSFEDQIRKVVQGMERSYRNRFLVKIGMHYKSVSVNEISYVYTLNKANFIHTFAGRDFDIDFTLEQLTEMLDPEQFYRINRSCIVNIESIEQMSAYSSSRLQLSIRDCKADELFVVSRDRVREFKSWVDR